MFLLLTRVPPDTPTGTARLDLGGAALATVALGLLAWGLTGSGGEGSAPEPGHVLRWSGAGLVLLVVFLVWESRVRAPMMPLRLFASRAFSAANALTFCLYFALSGVLFYLPMTLIGAWGLGEAQVGAVFVPLSVAMALGSGPVGALAARIGPRPLIAAGAAMVGVAYAVLGAGLGLRSFWFHVLPTMTLMGVGMTLVVSPLSTAVMGAAPDADAGAASGINNAVSRMAGLIAVAGLGLVASLTFAAAGGTGGFGGAAAPEATVAGMQAVAFASALLCGLAAAVAWIGLPAPRPAAGAP